MLRAIEPELLLAMDRAHEAGIKLEIQQGLPLWELLPSPLHTIEAERIARSIGVRGTSGSSGCGCHGFQDMAIRFPDGSIRRPDIAIFCQIPEPTQQATTSIPAAVIELVSPGSEVKDFELGPPFYLLHGVEDVVVFDPRTKAIRHHRREEATHLSSPAYIALQCGCQVTV